ncbi:CD70 antigen [Octodon degus]|uniref:CD70 antigen n=1 Tax=Octodon degus TaxID=10160 RepID=A0A6P6EKG8_OCTDE|nr:CD70 antigen [Octodon degus]XP_023572811.1 CD70 antigen [Octodon degus]XP_023572812.1 CD70 antigen [Octodon degus]
MEENRARCQVVIGVLSVAGVVGLVICYAVFFTRTQPEMDMAELQLNLTGPRQEPRLRWQAGPSLGRSFLHGPALVDGQLRVLRDGIYRLHIQVTLARCSPTQDVRDHSATLTVGICSASNSITLLRRDFGQDCTVDLQRLTQLASGDILCSNLTLQAQPSPNDYETFFGIQQVRS